MLKRSEFDDHRCESESEDPMHGACRGSPRAKKDDRAEKRHCPISARIFLFLIFTPAIFEPSRCCGDSGRAPPQVPAVEHLLISTKRWEGEYSSSHGGLDGVETSPTKWETYLVATDGSSVKRILDIGLPVEYATFSHDAKWIYFQSGLPAGRRIYRCREDGSGLTCLTANDSFGKDSYGFRFSADGSMLTYTVLDGRMGHVAVMNADGTSRRLIAPDLGYCYMSDLSPQKDRVVLSRQGAGYKLMIVPLDGSWWMPLRPNTKGSVTPQFTPNGRTVVFSQNGDIYTVKADGANLRRLTAGNVAQAFSLSPGDQHGSSDPPDISRDGRQIAYVAFRNGIPQVHTMTLEGTDQRQITNRPTATARVRWSRDSKHIAFVSLEGGYFQLFVVDAQGGEPRRLTNFRQSVVFMQWRPVPAGDH
jgi:Tol biopolymer transport system component